MAVLNVSGDLTMNDHFQERYRREIAQRRTPELYCRQGGSFYVTVRLVVQSVVV